MGLRSDDRLRRGYQLGTRLDATPWPDLVSPLHTESIRVAATPPARPVRPVTLFLAVKVVLVPAVSTHTLLTDHRRRCPSSKLNRLARARRADSMVESSLPSICVAPPADRSRGLVSCRARKAAQLQRARQFGRGSPPSAWRWSKRAPTVVAPSGLERQVAGWWDWQRRESCSSPTPTVECWRVRDPRRELVPR